MPTTQPSLPAWDDSVLKQPHAVADKRSRVRQMFAAIAPSYELNNRLHSLGQDSAGDARRYGLQGFSRRTWWLMWPAGRGI